MTTRSSLTSRRIKRSTHFSINTKIRMLGVCRDSRRKFTIRTVEIFCTLFYVLFKFTFVYIFCFKRQSDALLSFCSFNSMNKKYNICIEQHSFSNTMERFENLFLLFYQLSRCYKHPLLNESLKDMKNGNISKIYRVKNGEI